MTRIRLVAFSLWLLLVGCIALLLGLPDSVRAETSAATMIMAQAVFTPTDDAAIDSQQPAANFGSAPTLRVTNTAVVAAIEQRSLLRFDLSAMPVGSIVQSATLQLYQTQATGTLALSLEQVSQSSPRWAESTVTWSNQPATIPYSDSLAAPVATGLYLSWDVSALVRNWQHLPDRFPNEGILLRVSAPSAIRLFESKEGVHPPRLLVDYSAPPTAVTIPYLPAPVKLDGVCDTIEYRGALNYPYLDQGGVLGRIVLKQDDNNFYACVTGVLGNRAASSFGLYLDRNNGREKYAQPEDYALRLLAATSTPSSFTGTGNPAAPYQAASISAWQAASSQAPNGPESAEFSLPLNLLTTTCSQPFGLALYHQAVQAPDDAFGWPVSNATAFPNQWVEAQLQRPNCPIRVCLQSAAVCSPATEARVYSMPGGKLFAVDSQGFLIDRSTIVDGTRLWALTPAQRGGAQDTLFYTSGDPLLVNSAAFQGGNAGVMTLLITPQKPLWLQNLDVSAQWYVQANPAKTDWLRDNLLKASQFFYDFTDGQFALGAITVRQNSEGWADADLRLRVNNVFQPRATIGGVVNTPAIDPSPQITITYNPGNINMGSSWNRYGTPPGQAIVISSTVVPTATLESDWSIALAHELGHYLLFLFDTYTDASGQSNQQVAKSCTGSAMGDAYDSLNWGFVYDSSHWKTNCSQTEAYARLQGRSEWDTIGAWYGWTIKPTSLITGAILPAPLTTVNFVAPGTLPGTPATSQSFDLLYLDGETASAQARAFILRNNRVYEQGKPAKGSTRLELLDALLGDRLCVFDVNDQPDANDGERHQFGCEVIVANDAALQMTKDNTWAPLVTLLQSAGNQLTVQVSQTVNGGVVQAALYPEDGQASSVVALVNSGSVLSGSFVLTTPVPPAYVQIFVNESPAAPSTRREVIVDRGTGGGGAFGPKSYSGGVLVISSDGSANYEDESLTQLLSGQSIAWQNMPGTPPLPAGFNVIGQSYRLDAFPASLLKTGQVKLVFTAPSDLDLAQLQGANPGSIALHFWNGTAWRLLPTTFSLLAYQTHGDGEHLARSEPLAGQILASAPGQGVGVYAILRRTNSQLFLPLIYK
jgi:hypothetical protein